MVISVSKSDRQRAWELAYLVRLSTPAVPTLAQRFAEHYKAQPSADIPPAKAKKILQDGEVHGKPLTEKQEGLFGAAAGKEKDYAAGYDRSQLAIGTRIEMEHTHDPNVARKIALDHLRERGDYYTLLQKMEDDPQFLQANYAKDKAMIARNKLISGLAARFSRGVEIIDRCQQTGFCEPELGMPRPNEFGKIEVNYRPTFSVVRCKVCHYAKGKSCKIVKGDFDPECVCDMFKAQTPKHLSWRIEDTPAPAV